MGQKLDECGINYLRIIPYINSCPVCTSPFVGKGLGSLTIDGYYITRSCKCGYKFRYDMRKGKSTKDIKEAVKKAKYAKGAKK